MRPVFAIDHSKIEVLAVRADEFQDIACVVSEVTEASRFQKDLGQAFFKVGIVCQESYDRCFHARRIHERRDARSAVIAI